jgi:NADH:ubiquinone reductase (H+-translocating)
MQVVGLHDVYALGDLAEMKTPKYPSGHPQVAQPAIQQANLLASNILRKRNGRPVKEFEYKDKGSMATIGRHLAVADLPTGKLNGFIAWILWLFVHLISIVGVKNRLFIFINWMWNYFTYDHSLRLLIRPKVLSMSPDVTSEGVQKKEKPILATES